MKTPPFLNKKASEPGTDDGKGAPTQAQRLGTRGIVGHLRSEHGCAHQRTGTADGQRALDIGLQHGHRQDI